ncbi:MULTISPECIES: HNH endonuclease signature motif containing protein [Gordonia]|uniref:HNH endonuclease signature motif containing protein n=1 Tax=Gordonia TaxID=2053 RepID=UPI0033930CFD
MGTGPRESGVIVRVWTDLPSEFLAGIEPAYVDEDDMVTLTNGLSATHRGQSYLAWSRYQTVAVLYDRLVAAREHTDAFVMDGYADCTARIARQSAISRRRAETLIDEALTLRDRLPEVATTLRDGIITDDQIRLIISRTDLIPTDSSITPIIDAEIAATLRRRRGSWDRARLRDMIDRHVFRHDPDLVRQRRQDALDARGVWTDNFHDGVGEITAVMSAENIRISATAVRVLADSVCEHDGRSRGARTSDAMFALLTRTAFECLCDRGDCTATIPDPDEVLASLTTAVVVHVVTDAATLAGSAGPGFLDGYGVISDDHVRDLAARPDATLKPVTPSRTRPIPAPATSDRHTANRSAPSETPEPASASSEPDMVVVYPGAQPADPYRPTSACADFVRVRDGYCTEPGCERTAFDCDLDHVTEYDPTHPAAGGTTSSDNLNAKCRAGHLLKTHGEWIDEQYRDHDGRLVTEYTTPEGVTIAGDAETLEDLFPNLRRIRFEQAAQAPPSPRTIVPADKPRRTTSRLAAKLARRRAERARNKRQREAKEAAERQDYQNSPPPF